MAANCQNCRWCHAPSNTTLHNFSHRVLCGWVSKYKKGSTLVNTIINCSKAKYLNEQVNSRLKQAKYLICRNVCEQVTIRLLFYHMLFADAKRSWQFMDPETVQTSHEEGALQQATPVTNSLYSASFCWWCGVWNERLCGEKPRFCQSGTSSHS